MLINTLFLILSLIQSVPVPAPAQSEYMIIPPPAPTGGARTRPQPGVQPPPPSHPPPPTNPPRPQVGLTIYLMCSQGVEHLLVCTGINLKPRPHLPRPHNRTHLV